CAASRHTATLPPQRKILTKEQKMNLACNMEPQDARVGWAVFTLILSSGWLLISLLYSVGMAILGLVTGRVGLWCLALLSTLAFFCSRDWGCDQFIREGRQTIAAGDTTVGIK
ncbi:MAG: hypothetical protein LBC37_03240, partial [Zoogloeaceae bacterium]|nr:hypothetical protein [Zoogloeaceae bacterium]